MASAPVKNRGTARFFTPKHPFETKKCSSLADNAKELPKIGTYLTRKPATRLTAPTAQQYQAKAPNFPLLARVFTSPMEK